MIKLKDSKKRRKFKTGAVRDIQEGKGRMDLLPMRAIMELSKLYEAGCIKYGDRNWEKGIDLHAFADSGPRHFANFMIGKTDEAHLVQACWNFLNLLDTVLRIRDGELPKDLFDLPFKKVKLFSGDLDVTNRNRGKTKSRKRHRC
jgi:hypothetical protein